MILRKGEIREYIKHGLISGYKDLEVQLQPTSFDLSIKRIFVKKGSFFVLPNGRITSKDISGKDELRYDGSGSAVQDMEYKFVELHALKPYIIQTNEVFNMPVTLSGLVTARSTLMRMNCLLPATWVDPGYNGRLHILIVPTHDVMIFNDARVAQIIFFDHDATDPYQGKYQGTF